MGYNFVIVSLSDLGTYCYLQENLPHFSIFTIIIDTMTTLAFVEE